MTTPRSPLAPRVQELVTRVSGGDRSTALALHALISTADDRGGTDFNRVSITYRDDYLEDLRAAGWDAQREAGRLSLDEVRRHLVSSVLPRLVADGVIGLPAGSLDAPDAPIAISPHLWAEIRQARADVADVIRQTGEHATPRATAAVATPPRPPLAVSDGSVLEAKGLTKIYRRRRVVNDVALRLQQGEIVGLLGPNGAGKTTTFYMIVGLIQPLGGQIVLDGRDITSMPMYRRARQGIGYLSQEPSIFRKLTVEENILAILETLPLSGPERKARLERLLDELSIKHLRRSKAYALSGGERRRLEITRALVTQPKFMMLDEPFAGVDPIAVHDIQTIVAGLRHRGIGVLISDHNVEQTLDIVDRAYIMFDGQVKVSGTVRELVFDDTVADIYLGPTLTARLRARFSAEGHQEAS
jgi:lipopolysaccharide export system ATP-binding protein